MSFYCNQTLYKTSLNISSKSYKHKKIFNLNLIKSRINLRSASDILFSTNCRILTSSSNSTSEHFKGRWASCPQPRQVCFLHFWQSNILSSLAGTIAKSQWGQISSPSMLDFFTSSICFRWHKCRNTFLSKTIWNNKLLKTMLNHKGGTHLKSGIRKFRPTVGQTWEISFAFSYNGFWSQFDAIFTKDASVITKEALLGNQFIIKTAGASLQKTTYSSFFESFPILIIFHFYEPFNFLFMFKKCDL